MYKLNNDKYKIPLLICLAIFLLVCFFTSIYYGNKLLLGDLELNNNDDVKYLRAAETLLNTGMLTYKDPQEPTVFIMPGLVFALVPFVAIFGKIGSIVAFRIFSAILQTFTLYVIYLIFKKVFNSSKIAFVTVLLNLIYVANIYATTLLLSETIFTFLLINLLYICIFAVERKSKRLYVVGGIIWALSVYFKPIMLAFPLVVFVMMLVNKYTIKEMFVYAILPLIILVMCMSPWWIRNYITFDRFIPLTLSSGNPKLQGAYINYDQNPSYKDEIDFSNVGEFGNEIQNNETETKRANAVIKYNLENNTLEFIYWMTIGKTIENFKFPFIWYDLYGIGFVVYAVIHAILLLLGIIGICLTILLKRFKEYNLKFVLIAIIVFFNIVHLPYYCFARYVYPIMPILIGFSAIAVVYIIERIKEKRSKV